ncbi:hypothetical protein MMC14_002161 [Varicellaria rhodocarpa]|nr:hypothetical protein [Varicellaria rhodocarpa]
MSTDYSKKKNAELEELLKAHSLPHTGKKADLIARLQAYDKDHPPTESKPAAPTPSTATIVADDEIDWDDDEAGPDKATDPSAASAIAAGGQGRVDNPLAVPNQVAVIDPSTTDDLTITGDIGATTTTDDAPEATTEPTTTEPSKEIPAETNTSEEKPAEETPAVPPPAPVQFTAGLSSTTLDEELEKRKSRAARFGIQETTDEALKALERAKRFGTAGSAEEKTAVKGLDTALPERTYSAGRKRGRRGDDEERSTKRVDRNGRRDGGKGRDAGRDAGRGRDGGRGGQRMRGEGAGQRRDGGRERAEGGGQERRERGGGQKKEGGATGTLSEKDKQAAEARKKRFTAAAA